MSNATAQVLPEKNALRDLAASSVRPEMAAQQTLAVTACCRASSRGGFFPGDAASTVSLPLAALLMICSPRSSRSKPQAALSSPTQSRDAATSLDYAAANTVVFVQMADLHEISSKPSAVLIDRLRTMQVAAPGLNMQVTDKLRSAGKERTLRMDSWLLSDMLASMEPSTSSWALSSAVLSDTGCGYGGSASCRPRCSAAGTVTVH